MLAKLVLFSVPAILIVGCGSGSTGGLPSNSDPALVAKTAAATSKADDARKAMISKESTEASASIKMNARVAQGQLTDAEKQRAIEYYKAHH
jgi:hypothetical protein